MLKAVRDVIASRIHPQAEHATDESDAQALRVAAAALLFEVSRIDGEVGPDERTVMRAAIQGLLGLSADETEELLGLAEEESHHAVSVYEFTKVLDRGLLPDEKKRIVELLWLVAFADAGKSALEEHLIRKIAGLLHVPHPDFIDAKIRAREARDR